MKTSQETMREIERLYGEYEKEVHSAKTKGYLMENTVRTHLIHSGNFVKWCRGNFIPGDKTVPKQPAKRPPTPVWVKHGSGKSDKK